MEVCSYHSVFCSLCSCSLFRSVPFRSVPFITVTHCVLYLHSFISVSGLFLHIPRDYRSSVSTSANCPHDTCWYKHWVTMGLTLSLKSCLNHHVSGVRGWQTLLTIRCWYNFVSYSHVSYAFSKRNTSSWTVWVLDLVDFGCRWINQLWRVTEPRSDLENPCGHDMLIGEV